ncbi:MAG: hypothetical protein M3N93_12490 [Acidobacteriota bacterium]|nr:hypothetical protein [Acidobacteriota bacterium]
MNLFHYLEHPASYWMAGLLKFWSSAWYRPLGGLIYLAIYHLFGFHALPFKIALFAILMANMTIYFRAAGELSGSKQIALWALLLCSYHAAMNGLYLDFGTIYDVLGYTFYFSAFLVYAVSIREGKSPGFRVALIAGLYIAGLCCKEMVVTFPAVLAVYNLVLTGRLRSERWKWPLRSGLPILICFALGAVYTAGKMTGPDTLAHDPNYAPHFTLHQFATISASYIRELFYMPERLPTPTGALWIIVSMLAIAMLLGSELMVFCVLCIVIAQLPVSFMAPRGAFAIYIPVAFWALYFAAAIDRALGFVRRPGAAQACFVTAAVLLAALHFHMKQLYDPNFTVQAGEYEAFSAQLDAWAVQPAAGARVLLMNDPFRADWIGWDPMFLINVRSNKTDIVVNRLKFATYAPPLSEIGIYDYLVDYDSGGWRLLKKPGMPLVIGQRVRDLAGAAPVSLLDGFHPPAQSGMRQVDSVFRILTKAGNSVSMSLFAESPVRLSMSANGGPFIDEGIQKAGNFEMSIPLLTKDEPGHTLTFQAVDETGKPVVSQLSFMNAQVIAR